MSAEPRRELRALLIEDSPNDAELVVRALRHGGYDPVWERVDTEEALRAAIAREWDVALSDYRMPQLDAPHALAIIQGSGKDLPFIVVSGTIGEEVAVGMMRAGAKDYLLKGNLTRLPAAVEREIREARGRALKRTQDRVMKALHEVSTAIMTGSLEPRRLAEAAVHTARELLAVDLAAFYWWSEEEQHLLPIAEEPLEERIGVNAIPLGIGASGVAFQRREPVVIDDYASWPHALPQARALVASAAAVPVLLGESALGALFVRTNERRVFTPEEVAELSLLAAQAAPGIQMAFQRTHDALTGLPNRSSFLERIAAALRSQPIASVLVLDLDEFKAINQGFGHAAGDALLREVASRLRAELGLPVHRVGADEFACVLGGGTDAAAATAERLIATLATPIRVAPEQQVIVGASIGIATYPDHAASADLLLRYAEGAEYAAKRSGSRLAVHHPQRGRTDARALTLLAELPRALAGGELILHYQRQIDIAAGTLAGVEALVRWRHPTQGLLAPASFLPAAERTPLISALFDEVLRLALEECSPLLEAGMSLAVNLSMRDLHDSRLPERVARRLEAASVPRERLTLEITEGLVMADPESARSVLGQLRDIGVRIALDDFGTGYSSMAYLQTLPVNELKIDRTFVSGIPADRANVAIVRATVDLARGLGLTTLAEGVERPETRAALVTLGCDRAQGYLFGRPGPIGEISTEDLETEVTT